MQASISLVDLAIFMFRFAAIIVVTKALNRIDQVNLRETTRSLGPSAQTFANELIQKLADRITQKTRLIINHKAKHLPIYPVSPQVPPLIMHN